MENDQSSSSNCSPSCWLKFIGWTEIILYPILAILSIVSFLLTILTKEPVHNYGITFDWIEILLILSIGIPWAIVTIPIFIVEVVNHYLSQLFPSIKNTVFTIIDDGRNIRVQTVIRMSVTVVILLVGTYMSWLLLLGIKQKNMRKLKIWAFYICILMISSIVEIIVYCLLKKFDPLLMFRTILSLLVHGLVLYSVLRLIMTIRKDAQTQKYIKGSAQQL